MAQGILAATHLGTPSTGDPTPVDYGIEDPGATVEDDAPASYPPSSKPNGDRAGQVVRAERRHHALTRRPGAQPMAADLRQIWQANRPRWQAGPRRDMCLSLPKTERFLGA
jgi:hypothetical protein